MDTRYFYPETEAIPKAMHGFLTDIIMIYIILYSMSTGAGTDWLTDTMPADYLTPAVGQILMMK